MCRIDNKAYLLGSQVDVSLKPLNEAFLKGFAMICEECFNYDKVAIILKGKCNIMTNYSSTIKTCIVQIKKGKNDESEHLEDKSSLDERLADKKLVSEQKKEQRESEDSESKSKRLIRAASSSPIQNGSTEIKSGAQQQLGVAGVYPDPLSADRQSLISHLNTIVSEYGPIIVEHAYQIYLERAGIKRLGRQIKGVLNRLMSTMLKQGIAVDADPWIKTQDMVDMVVRTPEQKDVVIREYFIRPIDRIPQNELRSYYAFFHAVRALLAFVSLIPSDTHR